ncbi:MAG: flagellar protein [Bdellovibrio sp. CG12_big_fil_rev_8_21_14_0_65_39_13]|nr:MAG: flagellar protein [Bdellovibrio sp. CG22_combo_CG10-13_8_21_14_all_39_27]PIQ58182.1 MAG: flagellar protein [Bdellovibrio sp. CG12_big_fil_rev_8_21_14_0_65_39_13]PIR34344.1 MAG: flagellar protein [Bdellovibrio sp. CG11_big_fil_rev_8_21_14_0_20_39_38]
MGNNPKINNMLIPNVSKLPGQKKVDVSNKIGNSSNPGEFQDLLNEKLQSDKAAPALSEFQNPQVSSENIQLSTHAAKRLRERNIEIDSAEFFKLKGAIETLKTKGGRDSLVITPKAAYIIDVDKNTIVTAVDKENMSENVFTKIDSTMILN